MYFIEMEQQQQQLELNVAFLNWDKSQALRGRMDGARIVTASYKQLSRSPQICCENELFSFAD